MQKFVDTTPRSFKTEGLLIFNFKSLKKQMDEYAKGQIAEVKTLIKSYENVTKDIREDKFLIKLKSGLKDNSLSKYNDEFDKELANALDKYNAKMKETMADLDERIQKAINK